MHFWMFWWLIFPIMGVGTTVFKRWMTYKERQLDIAARTAGEQAAQYAAKIERLEAHVAVLNRIVTDRSGTLADEIDGLRMPSRLPLN